MKTIFDFNKDKLFVHIDTEEPIFCCLQTMEEAFKDLTEIYHCTKGIINNSDEEKTYQAAQEKAFEILDRMKVNEMINLYPFPQYAEMSYLKLKRVQ